MRHHPALVGLALTTFVVATTAVPVSRSHAVPPPSEPAPPTEDADPTPNAPDNSGDLSNIIPTMRLNFGAAWLTETPTFGAPFDAGFAFDFRIGAVLARRSGTGLQLWPELGYSYGGPPSRSRNLATFGLGVHYGDDFSGLGWTPSFVAGSEGEEAAYGIRNSLIGRWYIFSAELSHTWTSVAGQSDQEVRFTVGFDVLLSIVAILFVNTSKSLGSD